MLLSETYLHVKAEVYKQLHEYQNTGNVNAPIFQSFLLLSMKFVPAVEVTDIQC